MLLKLPCNISDDFLTQFTNLSNGWVLGVKVHIGKITHKWVREGHGAQVLNIFYYILLTIFVMLSLECSPRLGSHPVVFSLVVHFYCILCFIYQYVCSILTAQLK